ncbi:transposase [Streptomyces sp. SS162]
MTDLVERLVPEELWMLFRRVVPPTEVVRPQGGGRRRAGDREALAAIIFVATSGCTLRQLPSVFGPPGPECSRVPTARGPAGVVPVDLGRGAGRATQWGGVALCWATRAPAANGRPRRELFRRRTDSHRSGVPAEGGASRCALPTEPPSPTTAPRSESRSSLPCSPVPPAPGGAARRSPGGSWGIPPIRVGRVQSAATFRCPHCGLARRGASGKLGGSHPGRTRCCQSD